MLTQAHVTSCYEDLPLLQTELFLLRREREACILHTNVAMTVLQGQHRSLSSQKICKPTAAGLSGLPSMAS